MKKLIDCLFFMIVGVPMLLLAILCILLCLCMLFNIFTGVEIITEYVRPYLRGLLGI